MTTSPIGLNVLFDVVTAMLSSSLLTRLCPNRVRKSSTDHLLKSFYAVFPPLMISLLGFLFAVDSHIFCLSPSWWGSHWLSVISCRDSYYDTAGVSSRTLPIGKKLCHQVACSYFEQELYVKWSKQLNWRHNSLTEEEKKKKWKGGGNVFSYWLRLSTCLLRPWLVGEKGSNIKTKFLKG